MKPEDKARQDIDRQLSACGWAVQDCQSMNIHAGPGVAVREFPVVKPDGKRGSVDYLLYADARAIAVVEAKPADHSLGGVEGQASEYAFVVDPDVPQPDRVHVPPARGAAPLGVPGPAASPPPAAPARAGDREAHVLDPEARSWPIQVEAVQNLERSLAAKTFTAAYICYRLVKFAEAKTILFLVDRNNLGKQTLNGVPAVREPVRKELQVHRGIPGSALDAERD